MKNLIIIGLSAVVLSQSALILFQARLISSLDKEAQKYFEQVLKGVKCSK